MSLVKGLFSKAWIINLASSIGSTSPIAPLHILMNSRNWKIFLFAIFLQQLWKTGPPPHQDRLSTEPLAFSDRFRSALRILVCTRKRGWEGNWGDAFVSPLAIVAHPRFWNALMKKDINKKRQIIVKNFKIQCMLHANNPLRFWLPEETLWTSIEPVWNTIGPFSSSSCTTSTTL